MISLMLGGLSIAAFLTLTAFNDSLLFFVTPSDLLSKNTSPEQRFRLGGIVKPQSVKHEGENIHFIIMDQNKEIEVLYQGLLPDLFREGQGVVAEGRLLDSHRFSADTILAKHDENYMPKDVADRLKKQGLRTDVQ